MIDRARRSEPIVGKHSKGRTKPLTPKQKKRLAKKSHRVRVDTPPPAE